jgi:hypothetical protein
MSWQTQYELTCDGYAEAGNPDRCLGGSGFTSASRKQTLVAALGRGWVQFWGKHYCPACWPVIQDRHIKAMYPTEGDGDDRC